MDLNFARCQLHALSPFGVYKPLVIHYIDSNSHVFNIEMREWPGDEAMLTRVHFAMTLYMYTVIVLKTGTAVLVITLQLLVLFVY